MATTRRAKRVSKRSPKRRASTNGRRETAAEKNARAQAALAERVRHFTETPDYYNAKRTPIQVRSAVMDEYFNGGSWRLRDRGIEPERYFKLAQALPSAFSWEELRTSERNGRRSCRNPQAYTITEGGRRVRMAGGNVFPTKREAQVAAGLLHTIEGGYYRVRALKSGEGRTAQRNGRRTGARQCRRSLRNPTLTRVQTDALVKAYAISKASKRLGSGASIKKQTQLQQKWQSLLDKTLDRLGMRFAPQGFMDDLDRAADRYIATHGVMGGAGQWW